MRDRHRFARNGLAQHLRVCPDYNDNRLKAATTSLLNRILQECSAPVRKQLLQLAHAGRCACRQNDCPSPPSLRPPRTRNFFRQAFSLFTRCIFEPLCRLPPTTVIASSFASSRLAISAHVLLPSNLMYALQCRTALITSPRL